MFEEGNVISALIVEKKKFILTDGTSFFERDRVYGFVTQVMGKFVYFVSFSNTNLKTYITEDNLTKASELFTVFFQKQYKYIKMSENIHSIAENLNSIHSSVISTTVHLLFRCYYTNKDNYKIWRVIYNQYNKNIQNSKKHIEKEKSKQHSIYYSQPK